MCAAQRLAQTALTTHDSPVGGWDAVWETVDAFGESRVGIFCCKRGRVVVGSHHSGFLRPRRQWWDTSSMGILIALILHWLRDNRRDVGKMAFSRQIPQEAAFTPWHVWDHRFVAASS